ncbi:ketoacyl-ACP synthase III [Lactobacillus sp. DCY120]|uniref:Beta-ketoacyl-[acyl-carrier-protein] synthase III n=1 Tax=Bombilactobacillus apium TaxID=2675299 RepID=A0A850R7M7_9LACO|nr:beta-ketoacyl-ACP synthase III [Bombilactobacillus apium]NVY96682.1 ketoacyl-ACP synthase III [Bombilactobacillus apium]
MGLRITQTAYYVPPKVVTNDDLSQLMDTSDAWIKSRTRIEQRHVSTGEQTSDLSLQVAQKLLAESGWTADSLDFIIVATMSPDYLTPATAAIVQGQIGATKAMAFDINAACSGFIYALVQANHLLQGSYQRGMVIGAETLSKLVDWHERSTAVLFGDGAGGVLVESSPNPQVGILAEDLRAFGQDQQYLTAGYQPVQNIFMSSKPAGNPYFAMDGRRVYYFATHEVPNSVQRALKKAPLTGEQVDWWLLHQANGRIVEAIANHLHQPQERFLTNVASYGNTSAASIPILLAETVAQEKLQRGQRVVLSGFGGGLTVGSVVLTY